MKQRDGADILDPSKITPLDAQGRCVYEKKYSLRKDKRFRRKDGELYPWPYAGNLGRTPNRDLCIFINAKGMRAWILLHEARSGSKANRGIKRPSTHTCQCRFPACTRKSGKPGFCKKHLKFQTYFHAIIDNPVKNSLTREQAANMMEQPCSYCFEPPPLNSINGLDQIFPDKGYAFNNAVACCTSCNYEKRDTSPQHWVNRLCQTRNWDSLLHVKKQYARRKIKVIWPEWVEEYERRVRERDAFQSVRAVA